MEGAGLEKALSKLRRQLPLQDSPQSEGERFPCGNRPSPKDPLTGREASAPPGSGTALGAEGQGEAEVTRGLWSKWGGSAESQVTGGRKQGGRGWLGWRGTDPFSTLHWAAAGPAWDSPGRRWKFLSPAWASHSSFLQEVGLKSCSSRAIWLALAQAGWPVSSLFIPEPFIGNLLCARLQPRSQLFHLRKGDHEDSGGPLSRSWGGDRGREDRPGQSPPTSSGSGPGLVPHFAPAQGRNSSPSLRLRDAAER